MEQGFFSYSVGSERNFKEVAGKFDCREHLLRRMNPHVGITLKKGDVIKVPLSAGGCGRGRFYRLREAMSLTQLAGRFGISTAELMEANPCMRPEKLRPGQVIIIPPGKEGKESTVEYILKEGDTLGDVLRRFDTDILTLRRLNKGLDILQLRQGMCLCVPGWQSTAPEEGYYIVARGEKLADVAGRFDVSAVELLKCNPQLRPQEFCEGQRIRLPR